LKTDEGESPPRVRIPVPPPPPEPVFMLIKLNDFVDGMEWATTHVYHTRLPHTKLRKLK
jgi:hypothetical protein